MNQIEKLLKTWAYSVCAACCATAFSAIGDSCRINPKFKCTLYPKLVIVFTVISFVFAFTMLAAWLLAADAAEKICPLVSNLLLVLLVVAVGLVSRADQVVALITIFIALVLALMLAVSSWNSITNPPVPVKPDVQVEA